MLFNVLDGLTTLGGQLVHFTGPSFQDAHTVFTSGFIPGLHKAIGDISSQQLQNLTALSWQTTENIAPGGGTVEKFVYIQRNPQDVGEFVNGIGTQKKTRKQIANLMDLEVTGHEVIESEAKQATAVNNSAKATSTSTSQTGGTAVAGDNAPGGAAGGATSSSGRNK